MEKVPLLPLPSPGEARKLRKSMGLTLQGAAEEIGVSKLTLLRWEQGKTSPSLDNHRAYQQALTRWREVIRTFPRK